MINPVIDNLPQILAFFARRGAKAPSMPQDSARFNLDAKKKKVVFGKAAQGGDTSMLALEEKITPQVEAYQALANAKADTLSTMNKKYDLNANPVTVLSKGKLSGVKVPQQVMMDVIASAKKSKMSPTDLMAVMAQESTMAQGHNKSGDVTRPATQQGMMSAWDVANEYMPKDVYRYLADKGVKGISQEKTSGDFYVSDAKQVLKDLEGKDSILSGYKDYIQTKTKGLPKNASVLDLASAMLKKKGIAGYNPGSKSYSSEVAATKALLMADPKLRKLLK